MWEGKRLQVLYARVWVWVRVARASQCAGSGAGAGAGARWVWAGSQKLLGSCRKQKGV